MLLIFSLKQELAGLERIKTFYFTVLKINE
jgi:hypothetical protein